jgi:hypothetical protein
MRTCFLHIGTHKTGTTALQKMLSERADALRAHGFLYPQTARSEEMWGHHNIAWEIFRANAFRRENGSVDDLIAEIMATDLDVIISSEDFGHAIHVNQLKGFVDRLQGCGLRIKIIVYLRNQVDYIRSLYLEGVKQGSQETFLGFLRTAVGRKRFPFDPGMNVLHYDDILNRLGVATGADLIVRSYDAVRETSLAADFLSIFGLTPKALGVDTEPRANDPPPLRDLFSLFYQHRTGQPPNWSERQVISSIFDNLDERSIGLSEASRRAIARRFQRSNARVYYRFRIPAFKNMQYSKDDKPRDRHGLSLDDVFSGQLQYFVYDLARAFAVKHESLVQEHDTAVHFRNLAAQELSILHSERDALQREQAAAAQERQLRGQQLKELRHQYDALQNEHHSLREQTAENESLRQDVRRLEANNEALATDREAIRRELEAVLNTRSWRLTMPLRKLRSVFP